MPWNPVLLHMRSMNVVIPTSSRLSTKALPALIFTGSVFWGARAALKCAALGCFTFGLTMMKEDSRLGPSTRSADMGDGVRLSSSMLRLRTDGGLSPKEFECGRIVTSSPLKDNVSFSACNSVSAASLSEPTRTGYSTNKSSWIYPELAANSRNAVLRA